MKKNSFIEGSIIATLSIILIKILGMIYVIPFYKIVGSDGGALYSYGYNIYVIFLSISSAGIPNAISKIISEYNGLNFKEAKNRARKIAKKIITIISFIAFAILFIFAEEIGKFIIQDLKGNNTYQDIAFIIRCVSPAILAIPVLSVEKGYLQGHNYIKPSSLSELIEQIVRIFVILCGSYLCLKVFNGTLSLGVGIAISGAFFGGLAAYIYLRHSIKKNKEQLDLVKTEKQDEISNKEILQKIIKYALPFVILSIALHVYNFTDQLLVLRTIENMNYSAVDVEFIASAISTWAPKICTIITAFATGIATSLIPTIVREHASGNKKSVNSYINKSLALVFSISLPLAIGISVLAKPIWFMFYNDNPYGWMILGYTVFSTMLYNVYIILTSILQSLNKFKVVYKVALTGFIINAVLDVPLMHLFNNIGLNAFYGAITSSIIGYSCSLLIGLIYLKKKENIDYKDATGTIKKDIICAIVMLVVLLLINKILPFNQLTVIGAVATIATNMICGGAVFTLCAYKMGILNSLFGEEMINKVLKKLKFIKVKN